MRIHGKFFRYLCSDHLHALGWIALVTIILFGVSSQPRLLQDDWTLMIADGVFDRTSWFDWHQQRPLNTTYTMAAFDLFGTNITAYYWLNYFLVVGIYFMVYLLIDQFLEDLKPIALCAALLALVYPANFTATWLTMIINHISWFLTLLGMWLLSSYALRRGAWWKLITGSVLIFLPLWNHEASLGISAAWCVLLLGIINWKPSSDISRGRKLGSVMPLILLGSFAFMRIVVRPMLGIRGLNTESVSELTLGLLLVRSLEVKVLAKAWTDPFARMITSKGILISQIWLLAGLGIVVLMVMLVVSRLLRSHQKVNETISCDRRGFLRRLGWTIAVACGFIVAGMIPMIFIRPLNLEDITTRANLYAIPAAALVIASIQGVVAVYLARSHRVYRWLLWSGVIPLLFTGVTIQYQVQHNWQTAWERQQAIWQSIFKIAPDFHDHTTVVLIMQGYQRPKFGQHPPIYAEWEFDDALKVLYNNPTLEGRILFPRADFFSEATLAPDGVYSAHLSETSLYEDTVFLIYREAQGELQLLDNPQETLKLPFRIPGYLPLNRIREPGARVFPYRHLVGAE
jgi:hypothetical protein